LIAFLVVAYGFLPDAASHPLPSQFYTAVVTLYSWLYSLNEAIPVVETMIVVLIVIGIEIYIHMIIPFLKNIIHWVGRIN